MKKLFKFGGIAFLGLAMALSSTSCHNDDPGFDDVEPPVVPDVHDISGSVAGINGVGIAGATVTMSGTATGTTTTDANGYFVFSNVSVGSYDLKASATGKLSAETSVSVTSEGSGKNVVWNVMLASEESTTTINVPSTSSSTEGEVTTEALEGNDNAEVPVEVEIPANTLNKSAEINISPIYSEEQARNTLARNDDGSVMLVGVTMTCSDPTVVIENPIELTFNVDDQTTENVEALKYVDGAWVPVDNSRVENGKVIVSASEFTAYGLFGKVTFAIEKALEPVVFDKSLWDNLYGDSVMKVGTVSYTYNIGMKIKSEGTTVFTALLIEALARHFGANSFSTKAEYPINVDLPIGTYLSIKGSQEVNTVAASLGSRSVSGTQYGTVTIDVTTGNRKHNGGGSL